MFARSAARSGFTFIELLVVVAIIAALAGISLAGLAVLRKQQRIASTLDLMTHITTALDAYIREHRRLGNATDANDFLNDPWHFLYKDQRQHKKQPLLEINLERLVERVSPGVSKRPEAVHTATHMTDFFGGTPTNVLSFTIFNNNLGAGTNTQYVHCIILRSSAGTLGDPKDDLFYAYSADKASWRKLKYNDISDFLNNLDPVPMYDMNWVDPLSY
jgi:prepilin-type N-terminal cleavage/methylation domain-containing protein